MAYTRKIKKAVGKVSTAAKKRYGIGKGRGGFKFTQVAKDLEMIKSRLNAEKKFKDMIDISDSVGQIDGVATGGLALFDVTPELTQGVQESGRIGNSIRATGFVLNVAARGQINAHKRILKIMLIRSRSSDSIGNIENDLFDPNPLTGLRDFYSERNYSGSKGPHQIIATKYVKVQPNNDSSTGFACAKMAVKLNDIIRWDTNAATRPQDFQYHIMVMCDHGNKNLTIPTSNPGVLEQGAGTGVALRMAARVWYVDN